MLTVGYHCFNPNSVYTYQPKIIPQLFETFISLQVYYFRCVYITFDIKAWWMSPERTQKQNPTCRHIFSLYHFHCLILNFLATTEKHTQLQCENGKTYNTMLTVGRLTA